MTQPRTRPISQWVRYQEGYDAFTQGKDIDDNPYPPESENGVMWNFGWADAEYERNTRNIP